MISKAHYCGSCKQVQVHGGKLAHGKAWWVCGNCGTATRA